MGVWRGTPPLTLADMFLMELGGQNPAADKHQAPHLHHQTSFISGAATLARHPDDVSLTTPMPPAMENHYGSIICQVRVSAPCQK
jgi:hypothetical protein